MPPLHIMFTLSVTFLWGVNFIAMKESLVFFPPFLNLAVRFFCTAFPLIFFLKPPWRHFNVVLRFSCFQWMIQLSFINFALLYGVPPGTVSLFIQTKTLVVLLLAAAWYGYRLHRIEILGVLLSFSGLILFGHSVKDLPEASAYLFIIPAVLSISFSHLIFKENLIDLSPFTLTIWAAAFASVPMMILSFIFEGPSALTIAFQSVTYRGLIALGYSVLGATLLGTTLYIFLLKTHGPERIVPFNVLIPVWSLSTAALLYSHALSLQQTGAGLFIFIGLLMNQAKPKSTQPMQAAEKASLTMIKKIVQRQNP